MTDYIFVADAALERLFAPLGIARIFRFVDLASLVGVTSLVHSHAAGDARQGLQSGLPIGIVCGDLPDQEAEALQAWLSDLMPSALADDGVFRFRAGQHAALLDWLFPRLSAVARLNAQECATTALECARLRGLLETSQAAIAALETRSAMGEAARIIFQLFPDEDLTLETGAPRAVPIDLEPAAVHAIDVFVTKTAGALSNAVIQFELRGEHSNRLLRQWAVPEADLGSGWNRLQCGMFETAIREPMLFTAVSTSEACRTGLAAAKIGTHAFRRANLVKSSDARHPAIRVWSGVVGVELPGSDLGHLAVGVRPGAARQVAQAIDLLHLASPAGPVIAESDICWQEHQRGLLVHPNGLQPTVARVSGVKASLIERLTARFKLAHPEASATEFAIWAVPTADPKPPPLLPRLTARRPQESTMPIPDAVKWVALTAEESGETAWSFSAPFSGKLDVYFATRNLNKTNNFSWAVFNDLMIETAPPLPSGE